MKNTCLFYIISQVLKVILIKSYIIELPVLLFLVLHQQIDFVQVFRTSFFIIGKKKICHQFSFFNGFTQLLNNPLTYSHSSQNPISVRKCVFLCSVIQDHQTQLSKKHFFCREICFLTLNYLNYLNQQTRYFSKFCSVI